MSIAKLKLECKILRGLASYIYHVLARLNEIVSEIFRTRIAIAITYPIGGWSFPEEYRRH
ncbi:hypothetical protein B0H19DRAFT_1104538 [Mycena capillaripes]|nr:hypothetical protein B0H19DRAFT_1104538 [Mycena capillaripes]